MGVFADSTFHFDIVSSEREGTPFSSVWVTGIRQHYRKLPEDSKTRVTEHMKELFGESINNIVYDDNKGGINVTEIILGSDVTLEIQHMGGAFQKIFSSFVLFYRLIMPYYSRQIGNVPLSGEIEPISERLFLMEEPEALLYPALVRSFYDKLKRLCSKNSVKLIVSTHDQYIIHQSISSLPLSGSIRGTVKEEHLVRALQLELGHPKISYDFNGIIIVCEGAGDVAFIKHLAGVSNISLANVEFLQMKGGH